MSTQPSPTFSSNYDPEQGMKDLNPLLKSNGGKWGLIESGNGVERSFKFKTFKKTWVRRFPFPLLLASRSKMVFRGVKAINEQD
jgi:hypothetical protein